jgi:hypothetical protein
VRTPDANFNSESSLSAAQAAFLLEVVDEFREWICWKYGDGIREYYWENNISETDVVIGEDEPF